MILRLRMRERDYKTLGASIVYSLLYPPTNNCYSKACSLIYIHSITHSIYDMDKSMILFILELSNYTLSTIFIRHPSIKSK